MIIKCPECGHQVSDHAESCPSCGIRIAGHIMQCPHCGGTMLSDQDVCPLCLMSIHQPVYESDGTGASFDPQPQGEPQEPPKPKGHRTLWISLLVSIVVVAAFVLVGTYFYRHTQEQSELSAYENAMQSGEPAVLQNFLDIYVQAPADHRDSVEARLKVLRQSDQEWQTARVSKSRNALERFINQHPGSIHNIEARLMIDSLDWIRAAGQNTIESYRLYMDQHADGEHYADAKMNYDKLVERHVSPDEEKMLNQLFSNYFNALAKNDEGSLVGTVAQVLHSFLRKPGATLNDVVSYMHQLHADDDITGMNFLLNNDWKIDKIENIDTGEMEYAVTFSVNQQIDRTDQERERKNSYKVSAKVSPDGRIVDMNMRKIVGK